MKTGGEKERGEKGVGHPFRSCLCECAFFRNCKISDADVERHVCASRAGVRRLCDARSYQLTVRVRATLWLRAEDPVPVVPVSVIVLFQADTEIVDHHGLGCPGSGRARRGNECIFTASQVGIGRQLIHAIPYPL